ncbi:MULTISPECIES: hypothetical protein [unclassified Acinetobacter]|uniref:hypothetical protein n=1 Tax=unclassified Acinetobacter TaxID=196816 RepID=UPI001C222C74|nr:MULTISPECIES: hypothetical protein [unclassified Acinetobacter]
MSKLVTLCTLLCASIFSHAGLDALNQQELTDTVGQSGADLSWTLSLNHVYATDLTKDAISRLDGNGNPLEVFYVLDPATCGATKQFCRLAIAPNNHVDANGNKKWLVFKGMQGTIQIDKFSIDGTTIINHRNEPQTAMKIRFYDDKPLKIRNLGFNTVSIETGTGVGALEGYANTGVYSTYTGRTYNADGTYTPSPQDVPLFDKGTEKGFMGLNVHGNLHMSGNLKIFGYNCTGGAQSRC